MLTKEDNEKFTRVGPGTPTGNLLRRYWMPIAISADITAKPEARRLLGEDLVVFRTTEGKVGVVDERCSHRRTALTVGIPEKDGIRCGYHGWMFGIDGKCLEQPAEPRLNPNAGIKAYPAQELGGLIFVYMGPAPAPLLPNYDLFVQQDCLRDIGHTVMDFNWLQAMENSVDPHHAEWLHGHFMDAVRERAGQTVVGHYSRKHAKVGFDPFDYGIIKRRVLEGGDEEEDGWKIGHPLVFPNMVKIGGGGFNQYQIRVPLDDVTTWNIWYTTYTPPNVASALPQTVVPGYHVPLKDQNGEWILDFIDGQDIAAWDGQGRIADRSEEMLGVSDVGIVAYRKMIKEQLERLEQNQDPICTVRDPQKNKVIELPVERTKPFAENNRYIRGILEAQAVRYSPINGQLMEMFNLR